MSLLGCSVEVLIAGGDVQATMRAILDGMVRERSDGTRPAVLTAPLNIRVGTK